MEKVEILAFINPESELNMINFTCAAKFGFQVPKIDIGAQKIESFFLESYGIIIAAFYGFDKLSYLRFF